MEVSLSRGEGGLVGIGVGIKDYEGMRTVCQPLGVD